MLEDSTVTLAPPPPRPTPRRPRHDDGGEVYYTPAQVAAWCQSSSMTVGRWCDAGELVSVRTRGGHRRITASSVRDYMLARGIPLPRELAGGVAQSRPAVVIVDDDPRIAGVLARHLGEAGVDARVYADPYAALGDLVGARVQAAAVVWDMGAPGVDSAKALAMLRGLPAFASLAVFAWWRGDRQEADAEVARATYAFPRGDFDALERSLRAVVLPQVDRWKRHQP